MNEKKRDNLITQIKTLNAELENLLDLLGKKVKVVQSVSNANKQQEIDNNQFMTVERLLSYSRIYLN